MDSKCNLIFIDYKTDDFLKACIKLTSNEKIHCHIQPFNTFALELINKAETMGLNIDFYINKIQTNDELPKSLHTITENQKIDIALLLDQDPQNLSKKLMEYVETPSSCIIAPITNYYYKNLPLFLISIPKSGTHLLYSLAESFGYNRGVVCPDKPIPGHWYCIEYSNSHTVPKDFFIDTVRRSPFGNRDHPFLKSPAIFIYRNPLDILISEANYYHKDGKTSFYGYLSNKNFEDRLLTLIDDPWLLGSIRDRIGQYTPWLNFPNVIPVSFEELVGPQGGGNQEIQINLIWSLQLKLHIPGSPYDYAKNVFNTGSPTFNEGQIANYKKHITSTAIDKFFSLPQDFMETLGYSEKDRFKLIVEPKHAKQFRTRLLNYSEVNFDTTPVNVEYNYFRHNIVKYKSKYYIIPIGTNVGPNEFKSFAYKHTLEAAKKLIFLHGKRFLLKKKVKDIFRFLNLLLAGKGEK